MTEDDEFKRLFHQSSLVREFQAEREEVLKHRSTESLKRGFNVGYVWAHVDWMIRHRKEWLATHRKLT